MAHDSIGPGRGAGRAPDPLSPADGVPGEPRGIRCPACHCGHFEVLRTTKLPGGKVARRRQCRHCGRRLTTYERAFGG